MKKLKIATIVGTRPELIRLSRVIPKLDILTDHILIHTGQNYDYELNEIFYKDLGLNAPKYYLNAAAGNPIETISKILLLVDQVLEKECPDAVLILGDTNSCISALAAKKRKIPIFHMEAGNRCFDQNVPEEINRKIVDHISDINMPYSTIARDYLLKEGLPADRVIKTGSPIMEVLNYNRLKINNSDILSRLRIKKSQYFLVSCHREENVDDKKNLKNLCELLNSLAHEFQMPIIVSTHPRTMKNINELNFSFDAAINLLKPMSFTDYIKLQLESFLVLSDSGTITEESSILGFDALNIRCTHERPEGNEEGVVIMTGLKYERVFQAIEILKSNSIVKPFPVSDYSSDNVSDKVIKIIISYVDYVNKNVWNK